MLDSCSIDRLRCVAIATCLALCLAEASYGGETVIRNDSVADFGNVAIQVGFAADERAAVWLTATCTGNLTAVQVLWLSLAGGQPPVLGQGVRISQAGSFPTPGTTIVNLPGPQMIDGFYNEFPVPVPIPMVVGATVVVDFQFLDPPSVVGPSVVTDIDGCQAGRNAILAIPPGSWFSSCALGLSGDFAIRGVLDCATPFFADGFETGDTTSWSMTVP